MAITFLAISVIFHSFSSDLLPSKSNEKALQPIPANASDASKPPQESSLQNKLIRRNQLRYLKNAVSHFWRSFDAVLVVNAQEFNELWDKYLTFLRNKDLIDDSFKSAMNQAYEHLMSKHPELSSEVHLPLRMVKAQLIYYLDKRIIRLPVDRLQEFQRQSWLKLTPSSMREGLKTMDEDMQRISKIQKSRYLASRGDFIEDMLGALSRHLDKNRLKTTLVVPSKLALSFFDKLSYLKWVSRREASLLKNLLSERLAESKDPAEAIEKMRELVKMVGNNNAIKRLLNDFTQSSQFVRVADLRRQLDKAEERYLLDSHTAGYMRFIASRFGDVSTSAEFVNRLRQFYFPQFDKLSHLVRSCRRFSNSVGISLGSNLVPLGDMYSNELTQLGVVDSSQSKELKELIESLWHIKRDRKLPEETRTSAILSVLGHSDPSAPGYLSPFQSNQTASTEDSKQSQPKRESSAAPGRSLNEVLSCWLSADQTSPRVLEFMTSSIVLKKAFAMITPKRLSSVWTNMIYRTNLSPNNFGSVHLLFLQQLAKGGLAIKGLFRLKRSVSKYIQSFSLPRSDGSLMTKLLLHLSIPSYRKRRGFNISQALQEYHDKKLIEQRSASTIYHGSIANHLIVGRTDKTPTRWGVASNERRLSADYREWIPVNSITRLKIAQVLSLNSFIQRRKIKAKICQIFENSMGKNMKLERKILRVLWRNIKAEKGKSATAETAVKLTGGAKENTLRNRVLTKRNPKSKKQQPQTKDSPGPKHEPTPIHKPSKGDLLDVEDEEQHQNIEGEKHDLDWLVTQKGQLSRKNEKRIFALMAKIKEEELRDQNFVRKRAHSQNLIEGKKQMANHKQRQQLIARLKDYLLTSKDFRKNYLSWKNQLKHEKMGMVNHKVGLSAIAKLKEEYLTGKDFQRNHLSWNNQLKGENMGMANHKVGLSAIAKLKEEYLNSTSSEKNKLFWENELKHEKMGTINHKVGLSAIAKLKEEYLTGKDFQRNHLSWNNQLKDERAGTINHKVGLSAIAKLKEEYLKCFKIERFSTQWLIKLNKIISGDVNWGRRSQTLLLSKLEQTFDDKLSVKARVITSLSKVLDNLSTKCLRKVYVNLSRLKDKVPRVSALLLQVKYILKMKSFHLDSRANHSFLVLSKAKDTRLTTLQTKGFKDFVIMTSAFRRRFEHRLDAFLSRFKDKNLPVKKVRVEAQSILKALKRHDDFFSRKHLLILSKLEDSKELTNLRENSVRTVMTLVYPKVVKQYTRWNVFMQKMKDRFSFRPIDLKVKASSWTNKLLVFGKDGHTRTVVGRMDNPEVVSPKFALAFIGCYEKWFGDLRFGSWSDLHNSMKEYLEKVRTLDSSKEELAKIDKALLYLKPFYQGGNLNYRRFFSQFGQSVQLKLSKSFQGQTIAQIVESQGFKDGNSMADQLEEILKGCSFYLVYQRAFIKEFIQHLRRQDTTAESRLSDLMNSWSKCSGQKKEDPPCCVVSAFLQLVLSDVVELNTMIANSRAVLMSNVWQMVSFVQTNHQLILGVIGHQLMQSLWFVMEMLQQDNSKFKRLFSLLFAIKKSHFFSEMEELIGKKLKNKMEGNLGVQSQERTECSMLKMGLELMYNLVVVFGRGGWQLGQFMRYEFSGEVRDSMEFCSRFSGEFALMTSKIKDKLFWRGTQVNMLAKAFEDAGKKMDLEETKRVGKYLGRMYPNLTKRDFLRTFLLTYQTHFGDMAFRNFKTRFEGFFSRFVDSFRKNQIITHHEASALIGLFGKRKFFVDGKFNLKLAFGKLSTETMKGVLKEASGTFEAGDTQERTSAKGTRRQSWAIGRMRNKRTKRFREEKLMSLKLFSTTGQKLSRQHASSLLDELVKLRIKYFDRNFMAFKAFAKFTGAKVRFDGSQAAYSMYRTFNKMIRIETQKELQFSKVPGKAIKSMLLQELLDLGKRGGDMKRVYHKLLRNNLMKNLIFKRDSQIGKSTLLKELLDLGKRGGDMKRVYHKLLRNNKDKNLIFKKDSQIGKTTMLQELLGKRGGAMKRVYHKSLRNNLMNKLIFHRGSQIGKPTKVSHNAKSFKKRKFHSLLLSLRKSLKSQRTKRVVRTRNKTVLRKVGYARKRLHHYHLIEQLKLEFLRDQLSSKVLSTLKRNGSSKRVFLKMIDDQKESKLQFKAFLQKAAAQSSLFVPGLHRRSQKVRFKVLEMLDVESAYLKYLASRIGPSKANQLTKLKQLSNKRIRLKALSDSLKRSIFAKSNRGNWRAEVIKNSLEDFQRFRLVENIGAERNKPEESEASLQFVHYMSGLVDRTFGLKYFGRTKMPSSTATTELKAEKVYCCGCKCSSCIWEEQCTTGLGLKQCLEHQKRINQDAFFLKKASMMVNLSPTIKVNLFLRDKHGDLQIYKTIEVSQKNSNQQLLEELNDSSRGESKI
jgi:hypothetical protein